MRSFIGWIKGDAITWADWWREKRKIIVYVAGVAAHLLNLGVVPDQFVPYVAGALTFLAGVGIYQVTNQQRVPDVFVDPYENQDDESEGDVEEDDETGVTVDGV